VFESNPEQNFGRRD